ncbi:M3 family oligoendopeptidase [Paenibacillus sp. UMB4589-SE434]|uniref:M3 family oligoendopeptidase n=1 Tax=Paenibacillus sp. UMB4589-SE434 TaxID=3046314 RepID=UPI00254E189F|nr:M3 family oligoendopeptidase [Paenibacillus sp. UMB4589-SE434]MDK8183846.1 M3 family oligoendopeptidase [Paenibacillus sp. UMB4589-SE434]
MKQPLRTTWDLDIIFPGGSESKELDMCLAQVEQDIVGLTHILKQMPELETSSHVHTLAEKIDEYQTLSQRVREASAFIGCLTAQNTKDKKALQLTGRSFAIAAKMNTLSTLLDQKLEQMSDELWSTFVALPNMSTVEFNLNESRKLAKEKLPPEQEALLGDLSTDGYKAWGSLYDTIVSHIRMETEENGKCVKLSAGQAHNKLSDPKRDVREQTFKLWEEAWGEKADFFADALNHLAGFRLKMYEHRGWDNVLKEPLAINRMSQETLDVMWATIVKNKPVFVQYLERKAKLLGVEKLTWCDVEAPIGESQSKISYDEGAAVIVEQFRKFSPDMADFAVRAFENNWIEAEDRDGKRPGGFCTSLPVSRQTRIFMTYAGTPSNVSTLAHELGHGYHQFVMDGLPAFAQRYAMNVAETASTFAEMIVADSAVKQAKDEQEKLALLEDKIARSVTFYMNIHARFLFETRFYEARKDGLLATEQLCELMVEAQKEAFCDSLSSYHPHFWASKLHFYKTAVPFYNFPYTFGYLFSTGIYARALEEGETFAAKYDALLRDTASMTVEDLARKHLDVDLTKPDFWQKAIDVTLEDVKEFMAMTE